MQRLRRICRRELVGFTECWRYAMPGYERDGEIEIAFKVQRRYTSLYVSRLDVMDKVRGRLAGLSVGKGCVRFPRVTAIDWDLVTDVTRLTATTRGEVC